MRTVFYSRPLALLLGAAISLPAYAQKPNAFIVPPAVSANEPFTFAVSGVVEGEVVDIKTVDGEVVSTKKPDRLGRVFLPTGLAAGTYLLATNHGRSSRLSVPETHPKNTTTPHGVPAVQGPEVGTLSVLNSGDARQLKQTIAGKDVPVLAADSDHVMFAPPTQSGVKPGITDYTVSDQTGSNLASGQLMVYTATAKLTQVTVPSGAQTHLIVTVEPSNLSGNVKATINGGPVTFTDGGQTQTLQVTNGKADFPLNTQSGANGNFQVGWLFEPAPVQADNKGGDTKALEDDGWVKFVEGEGDTKRTGKKKIVRKSEGFEQEMKIYDDANHTSVTSTTRTGQKRKTVDTETNSIVDGVRTEVVEHMEYESDGKGGWKPKSGTRDTSTISGGTKTTKTETWSPTAGWH